MTQMQFAEAFHLPITTLRDWEQYRSTPDAPARALLQSNVTRKSCDGYWRKQRSVSKSVASWRIKS
jgi:hypothetical protein